MRSDSPSPSWYEPPDLDEIEDDDAPVAPEPLVISAGVVTWTATN